MIIDTCKTISILSLYLFFVLNAIKAQTSVLGEDDKFWNDKAYASIVRAERIQADNRGTKGRNGLSMAKNVIIFIGDGMGLTTIAASRILKGQKLNKTGEETYLSWENFPNIALARTYNTDHQISDSAGTATAILCGVKTKMSVVGVNDSIIFQDCDSVAGARIRCIADWFLSKGKAAGVVTNMRITHATPSSLYARAPDRNLESEKDFITNKVTRTGEHLSQRSCMDIAWQLVNEHPGNALNVIMGGGWRKLMLENQTIANVNEHAGVKLKSESLSNSITTEESPDTKARFKRTKRSVAGKPASGERRDEDLIGKWKELRKNRNHTHAFVADRSQLNNVKAKDLDYLMGIFAHDHMSYSIKRAPGKCEDEPTLLEMTMKAMDVLERNANGYFLLVEGGRIDHGHHEGKARLALEETIAMDEVVAKVGARIGISATRYAPKDTLLIVTSDHSHVFNMGGYPIRGNPILGLNRETLSKPYELSDIDSLPYTTLTYGNGPGGLDPKKSKMREDIRTVDTTDPDYQAPAAVPLTEETHGGEDVSVYAIGPGSHLIYGVQEQNYIAHAMAYSTCVGPYAKKCSV